MKYIKDMKEGDRVSDIYLCKSRQSAITKNGKTYDNLVLQDKTGSIDAKIWDPDSAGIEECENLEYVHINGEIVIWNNAPQLNIRRLRIAKESEYSAADYLPVSKRNIKDMEQALEKQINSVENPYLKALLNNIFVDDIELSKAFRKSSAAKTVHHSFVGGLLEHTLSVAGLCQYYCRLYPMLNHDLLITAALCHDIGKVKELSAFPENDYTDMGQLLGHIVMGSELVKEKAMEIDGFPRTLLTELQHCILAHHGELEYGSPKKPALMEAVALNFADNTDARLQTFAEAIENSVGDGWLGFNRFIDSNIRKTKG